MSLASQLLQLYREFDAQNQQDIGLLTSLHDELMKGVDKLEVAHLQYLKRLEMETFMFIIRKFDDLHKEVFHSNSFNITREELKIDKFDVAKQVQWHLKMKDGKNKYGFVPLPSNTYGVVMEEEHRKLIDVFLPLRFDPDNTTEVELSKIRKEYTEFHERNLALSEKPLTLADTTFFFWVALRSKCYQLSPPRPSVPATGAMFARMPSIQEVCQQICIDPERFCQLETYRVSDALLVYAVDDLTNGQKNTPINEMKLYTAIRITQMLRTMFWYIPFGDAAFRSHFELFKTRMAILLSNSASSRVLDASCLTMDVNFNVEDNSEDSLRNNIGLILGDTREREVFPQLHCFRIAYSFLRSMTALVTFSSTFMRTETITNTDESFSEESMHNFLLYASNEIVISEPCMQKLWEDYTSMYVSPGCKFLFRLLNPFLSAEGRLIVPTLIGGRVYTLVNEKMKRTPFEQISDTKLGNHLRMVVALHIMENYLTLQRNENFIRTFVLWGTRMVDIELAYDNEERSYPVIAVIANQFVLIYQRKIWTANNNPELLLGKFFSIIADDFDCILNGDEIFKMLRLMQIRSVNLKKELLPNQEYFDILTNTPREIFNKV